MTKLTTTARRQVAILIHQHGLVDAGQIVRSTSHSKLGQERLALICDESFLKSFVVEVSA